MEWLGRVIKLLILTWPSANVFDIAMTLTENSRKRQRACDDDGCDFMPISKRINNLRIRANGCDSGVDDTDEQTCSSAGSSESGAARAPHQGCGSMGSPADNPHYYQINCLLHEVHLARQQRLLSASHQQCPSEHCPGPSTLR